MLRRSSPSSSATLTGGDLSVDILHTEDSVRLGDGTDLLSFSDVSATKCIPVDVKQTTGATSANQTNGSQRSKITDGTDNVEIDDVGGEKALKVSVIASVGGGGGGTAATDSAAYTATSSQFTPVGGAYDDTASDALAEGEMGMVRLTSGRAMHVAVQNSVAVTGTFWQATQPVSGTVTVGNASLAVTGTFWQATQPVSAASLPLPSGAATESTLDAIKTATQLIDDGIGTIGSATPTKGMVALGHDGTNARALKTDASGELQVDVLTMPTVAVTGTFWQATQPVSGTVTANLAAGTNNIGDVDVLTLPSLPAGTNNIGDVDVLTMPTTTVQGGAAHDAGISGQPVPVGYRAANANPTAVSNGDVCYPMVDLSGKTVVTMGAPRDLVVQATGSQATTTETSILAAGGAGVFHDLTCLMLTNSNTTTAAQVQIRDASTGTIRIEQMIPPNSGMVINFPVPFTQTTANNAWTIDLQAAVSTVYYTAQWIKRTA